MFLPSHFEHAAQLLKTILISGNAPADKHMERYFRANPKLGVHDRGHIAETVYGCLRRYRSLDYRVGKPVTDYTALVAVYLLSHAGMSARMLESLGYPEARALTQQARQPLDTAPLGVRTDLPDWLLQRLLAQQGDETQTCALAEALNQPATLDLRVNTLKIDRPALAKRLQEEGYPVEITPYSPVGLRRQERAPLFKTASFQAGYFEIQDEGSQLLAILLEPKRREMVVDFCAGAGGKTLHLGALMANSGSLYAFDISATRLNNIKARLKRAGLDTVRAIVIAHERDARVQRLHGKIDRVLVDAPCTGTGTLRRNPDGKWREPDLQEITDLQRRILAAAAQLLKPGGRLVYATCSLLKEENEEVVADFLTRHPDFTRLNIGEILKRRHVALQTEDDALRLYPHRHQTDGFYAAVLQHQ